MSPVLPSFKLEIVGYVFSRKKKEEKEKGVSLSENWEEGKD
jgi:hypothetical protein